MFKLFRSGLLIFAMLAVPSLSQADAQGQLAGSYCRNLLSYGAMSTAEAEAIRSYVPESSGEAMYPTPRTTLSSLIIRDAALFNSVGQAYARRLRFINDNCQKVCEGLPSAQGAEAGRLSCERVSAGATAEIFEATVAQEERFNGVSVERDLQTIAEVNGMLSLDSLFTHEAANNPEPVVSQPEVEESTTEVVTRPNTNSNPRSNIHIPNVNSFKSELIEL